MSKEEITKHKSETHEVAVALSRACPELAAALSEACPERNWRVEGVVEWVEGEESCFEFIFLVLPHDIGKDLLRL